MHPYLQRIFPLGGGSSLLRSGGDGSSRIFLDRLVQVQGRTLPLLPSSPLSSPPPPPRAERRVSSLKTKDVLIAGNRPSGNHL